MNQPFIEHLHELRRRITWSALVLGTGAAVGYFARNLVLGWLEAPLHGTLYYSKITGAFEFLMQACLLVGALCAIPVLVYNLVAFLRPAIPGNISRRQIIGVVMASVGLTVAGVMFAYYVSLPTLLHFLGTIDVTHLHPLIAADSYLSFVITYLAVFAAVFQLPLILLFINSFAPLPPRRLRKARKWVIIAAFGAALILPIAPDPVSQVMLAMPVVVLYEISIWLIVLAQHRRHVPAPVPEPAAPATPAPQRLPMAIAVPNPPPPIKRTTVGRPRKQRKPRLVTDIRRRP